MVIRMAAIPALKPHWAVAPPDHSGSLSRRPSAANLLGPASFVDDLFRGGCNLTVMCQRFLIILVLSCSAAFGQSTAPSEASIKELLELTQQSRKLTDSVAAQMDQFMTSAIEQVTKGEKLPPDAQKKVDQDKAEIAKMMHDILDYDKVLPMNVRIYQKSFTQEEVDGLIAFYKTPAGQALLSKMPVVVQDTFAEMRTMVIPITQRVQQMQQSLMAEMQKEKEHKG